MLTGRETVPATFAATAHLHRTAPAAVEVRPDGGVVTTVWGALLTEARHAALGLDDAGGGPGLEVVLRPGETRHARAVTLVVASVVGAVVVADGAGAGEALDLTGLAAAGALVDERAPDRFERVADGRSGGDPLLRVGPVVHSHGSLLVAARSLAQAAGIGLDDRLLVDLAAGTAVEVVAGLLVPCLTGAATWAAGGGVGPGEVAPGRGPTFAATGASAASTAPVPLPVAAPPRRRLRRRPPTVAPRAVQVAGHGGGPLDGAGANGLAVEAAGGLVTGFGRPGTLGRPLPGTSVAIDDDGTVLVRRGAVAPGAPGLREDGWLATGLTGSLDDGHLVLDGAAPG